MTPEPCPTCKGNCCGYTFDLRHKDGHKGNPFHYCPDCDDGTYEVCSDPESFVPPRTYEQGVEEGERRATAVVVAWLRRKATDDFCALRVKEACDAEKSAEAIERGEHRREEEP